ncbi:MAG: 3-methyl-2-oxobutanoate hydroxymethyltransferase [Chitinispirillales bacterium]|jgi:3-methyl-2-oxobutanoate hydroxymethyltransferase|nr:3-methyl-2-oxobutanoate hydroxymethyltransferase [Chitinispirillales bacterium]
MKKTQKPIAMITCYDALTAKIAEESGADYLLVGDSGGTNVLGYKNINEVKLNDICFLTKSVKRASVNCKIVSDIPYEIVYEKPNEIVSASKKLLECGADIVKLEIENDRIEMLKKLTAAKIPVCTHIGYTPQTPNLKAESQGKTIERAKELIEFAKDSQKFGAEMIVLELIPSNLAKRITEILDIVTIGIGAGRHCDGQVQVWCDIAGFSPKIYKHSKLFSNARTALLSAFKDYVSQVKSGEFPAENNTTFVPYEVIEKLK